MTDAPEKVQVDITPMQLACINCGATAGIVEITNRNARKQVTAKFFTCPQCAGLFIGREIKINLSDKKSEKNKIIVPRATIVPGRGGRN